ncbi:uncharacterized protein A4U43_C01F22410 [Asparagus officinalis]|uniref:noroxomaritidine synthase n=1 Tax=Asparagus officinalis TaxID=4686 RepID=A0A5P1FS43_ASPOF|nr:uncharacterized protein A4U43_C01F22410 [Asparagus officinalis]
MSTPKFRSYVIDASKGKVHKSLIPLLDHFAQNPNKTLDLQDVFMRLSFDITCILVFGVDPACLSIGFPTVPFASAMDDAEEVVFLRHNMPKAWWGLMRKLNIGPEKRLADAVKVLDHFIVKYVNERKEAKRGENGDLITSYLDSEGEIADNGFSNLDIFLRDTVLNLMVAGRDTISSALTWFFYLIAKNPTVEAKILDEIKTQGLEDLGRLVYLHAALCESLRLYPPVPFEHKGVLKPDRLPSGVMVHRNRRVLFSSYAMARMEGVWGKDCSEFRPERWISPETGKVRHEPSFKVRVLEGFVAKPKLSIILHMDGGLAVKVSERED